MHQPDSRRQIGFIALIAVFITLLLPASLQSQTPLSPGTLITNQAEAVGIPSEGASPISLLSNKVVTQVAPQLGLALETDRSLFLTSGVDASFYHTLTNTGNAQTTYTLTYSNLEGDDYDLQSLRLIYDVNDNDLIDAGDTEIAQGETLTLDPEESVKLILTGIIPNAIEAGGVSRVTVQAEIPETNLSDEVNDEITVGSANVQLLKGVDRTTASPGEAVLFSLSAITEDFPPNPIDTIIVDGQVITAVIIRDEIPRNTTFSRFVDTPLAAQPLYHLISATYDQEYTTTAPTDLTQVEAVAFAFDALNTNTALSVSFEIEINDNASGSFENQGFLYHLVNGQTINVVASNLVEVDVPITCPIINVFEDEAFIRVTEELSAGATLFIEVEAAFLNYLPTVVDELVLTVESQETGDQVNITFAETGPNTGIFRRKLSEDVTSLGIDTELNPTANSSDLILQTERSDVLTAIVRNGCEETVTQIQILIDPAGILFDSRTGERISGVTVSLIDVTGAGNGGNPGGLAVVFEEDGVTLAPSTVVTGSDGTFSFPQVIDSIYRLDVTPPDDYQFPSSVPESELPNIQNPRTIPRIQEGSYGEEFSVNQQTGDVFLDVPLDGGSLSEGYVLEKEVSREEVEIGDSVQYTLSLDNTTGVELTGVYIEDALPQGVTYIKGSTQLAGVEIADPLGEEGPDLRFDLGNLADGETFTVTYRARVRQGAENGDGINRARAFSTGPLQTVSNLAIAQINVSQGVFTDRGIIFGKVFIDLNDNTIHDVYEDEETGEEILEPVVPGVRIFLEDGTYAITDIEGKYSIYGQRAITHVVKLDTYTLPDGYELAVIDNRNANDPDSRFADLRKGELHKANFRLVEPTQAVLEAVEERQKQEAIFTAEINKALQRNFDFEENNVNRDRVTGIASGTIEGDDSGTSFFQSVLPDDTLNSGNSNLPERPLSKVPIIPLEQALQRIEDNKPGFIDFRDGDTLPMTQARIRVKGQKGAKLQLQVNGSSVSSTKRGKAVEDTFLDVQLVEYIAVHLQPGENSLELNQYDPFGNLRGSEQICLIAPDRFANIKLSFSKNEPAADGTTPVQVQVSLEDNNGIPVSARTALTLESSLGRWDVKDVNADEEGVQVFLTGGTATYSLMPPETPGIAEIKISSGIIESTEQLPFVPDLRPMIAAGILQGRVNLKNLGSGEKHPMFGVDGFEEELAELSGVSAAENAYVQARSAFFAKGELKDGWLLTAAYDSDKQDDIELFRDIDPDEYYPIYGDSSMRGFDAQSSGDLYVRLDKKRSFLLWGDYQTRSQSDVRDFGNYNRILNGFHGHYETNKARANFYLNRDTSTQVVVEVAANGTSGPYNFSAVNGILNSEQIEIITRDRNQLSAIINVEPKARFVDYEFEPFTGQVTFRAPISTFDSNLNPQFIRITYEVEQGGPKFWMYSLDGQYKLTDFLEIGGSYAQDENPENNYELYSGNVTVKLPFETYLIGEVANSDADDTGEGMAMRAELRRTGEKADVRIFYERTEDTFFNPSASLTPGRIESGAELTYSLDDKTQLQAQAVYTENAETDDYRQGVRADVIRRLPHDITLELGGRISEETDMTANPTLGLGGPAGSGFPESTAIVGSVEATKVRSVRSKISTPVPWLADAQISGELEQDVLKHDQRRVVVGGQYQVSTKTRLYGTHEFINSIGGEFELNTTQRNNRTSIGVETDYMRDGQFFNEYRIRDAIDGPQAEASTGLRNQWHIREGLRLNTSYERVTPFDGVSTNKSEAITAAYEYTLPENWKTTGRIERRKSTDRETYLNTFGYTRKLSLDWSFLGKTFLRHEISDGADVDDLTQGRLQTGLAWRQTEQDVWNVLFLYEYKYEDGVTFLDSAGAERQVHIVSNNINYQPNEDWIWMNRFAAKWVEEEQDGWSDRFSAYQINGRLLYLFGKRWDLGLNYALTWEEDFDDFNYGLGPEFGMWLVKDLRCGIGYNFWGYVDRDFNTSNETQSGFFVTLSLKFDEDLFSFERKDEQERR